MKLQQILEALSSIVYHYTSFDSAYKIVMDGNFILTNSINGIESSVTPNNHNYFLSTTRSVTGAYHRNASGSDKYGVMFVLDGGFYNHHYKSKPINYWGERFNLRGEAEDRLFSKTNKLTIDGVREAHIYFSSNNNHNDIDSKVRKFVLECKRKNIKPFLYTDRNAWLVLDKTKTTSIPDTIGYKGDFKSFKETEPMSAYQYKKRVNDLTYWLELIFKKDVSELSLGANKLLSELLSGQRFENVYNSLETIWSSKTKAKFTSTHDLEMIAKITKYMSDNNIKTLRLFFNNIRDKWQHIKQSETK